MGGLSHLFDFNQSIMARKLFTHKKHDGGLDAPRNSLELQVEPQSYCGMGDLPSLYQVEEDSSKKNYPFESSMKKLINEEISKRSSTRQNAPNIVARLMGMDMPMDTKSAVQPIEEKSENRRMKSSKKEMNGRSSVDHVSSNLSFSRQMDLNSYYHNNDGDATKWDDDQKIGNPRRREHPQEEELKKFKKEFEAWQAARFRECSRIVEKESTPRQLLGQEDLNKEKMALSWRTATKKIAEPKIHEVKAFSHEGGDMQYRGDKTELFPADHEGSFSLRSRRTMSLDFDQSSLMNSKKRLDSSSAPTRIVILKPGPDRLCNYEETWIGSSDTSEQRGGIEDFLEEVKERLKCELQGKMHKRGSVVRGSGIETPFSEQPSNPKQIARHIANHVRESVSRDLGMNLLRSESTRSYRSEVQFNGPGSPEFIHRDSRRILLERLRSVPKRETDRGVPVLVSGSSRLSALDNERVRQKRVGDTLEAQKDMSCWERGMMHDEHEKTRSFRHGPHDDELLDRELSSRNLIRSLSAPVPGTSFGKLLLEDRHVLTGAHIQRKHEGIGRASMEMKNQKKERFNLKEKVSNFRYSFTLRGRLFGKKVQSIAESRRTEHYPMKDIMSGPTVIMNSGERHDNFTEVPPSPASVCSSAREEFWRPTDYLSPISTPSVTSREDDITPQVFRDISDNLNELRRQLNQLESDEPLNIKVDQKAVEPEMVGIQDPAEVYIRDLLVASGLYNGSFEKSLSRWDTFAKPISNSVFEQVEESYQKLAKKHDSSAKGHNEKVNHEVLRDLLNEALTTVLAPPIGMSKFRRKMIDSSALPPLHGKKLLNCVWRIICERLHPPTDEPYYSLDDMVAWDLGSSPWSGLMDDDVNAMGREMESLIMRDLVEEILDDMQ